jgi:hypothetical protein
MSVILAMFVPCGPPGAGVVVDQRRRARHAGPVDFTLSQDFDAPPAAVDGAFVDATCLATMDQLPKIGRVEVLDQTRDGDTVHQRVRYQFLADLSGAVRRVVDPDQLTWIEASTHDLGAHTASYRILPDHYANLLEGGYDTRITNEGAATRRTATGVLSVHVPIVGGKVEHAIVSGLEENAAAQAALVAAWLGGHA